MEEDSEDENLDKMLELLEESDYEPEPGMLNKVLELVKDSEYAPEPGMLVRVLTVFDLDLTREIAEAFNNSGDYLEEELALAIKWRNVHAAVELITFDPNARGLYVDINQRDSDGASMLALSVLNPNPELEILRALLGKNRLERDNKKYEDQDGTPRSILGLLCCNEIYADAVDVFEKVVDLGYQVNRCEPSPVFFAIEHASAELLQYLIDYGCADQNITDDDGDSPLTRAILCDDEDAAAKMVSALAEGEIDLDQDYGAAIFLAIEHAKVKVLEQLLEHGADPDIYSGNDEAYLPLNMAMRCENVYAATEMTRLLLIHGADPTLKNYEVRGDKFPDVLAYAREHNVPASVIRFLENFPGIYELMLARRGDAQVGRLPADLKNLVGEVLLGDNDRVLRARIATKDWDRTRSLIKEPIPRLVKYAKSKGAPDDIVKRLRGLK